MDYSLNWFLNLRKKNVDYFFAFSYIFTIDFILLVCYWPIYQTHASNSFKHKSLKMCIKCGQYNMQTTLNFQKFEWTSCKKLDKNVQICRIFRLLFKPIISWRCNLTTILLIESVLTISLVVLNVLKSVTNYRVCWFEELLAIQPIVSSVSGTLKCLTVNLHVGCRWWTDSF